MDASPPHLPDAPVTVGGEPDDGRFPTFAAIRRRIVSGLVFALPIAITFWVVYWLYSTLQRILLDPGAMLVRRVVGRAGIEDLPWWWERHVSPLIALILALILLYFLGHFGRSRLHRVLDRLLLRVPIVGVIFKAVRNVFASLEDQRQAGGKFKRVVLVPFPTREVRSPAFVTRSMQDASTGRIILAVYVPYAPLPTTGLILLVPEDLVIELAWDVNEAMQTVISFGISAPAIVNFDAPSLAAERAGTGREARTGGDADGHP